MEPIAESNISELSIYLRSNIIDPNSLDINAFILEIQGRPAIWDCNTKFYRNDRVKAWEEICQIFVKDFAHLKKKDKNAACNKLQRKWKGLRDCFNREIGKQKNSKKPGRKKYLYFNKLTFLKSQRNDIPLSDDETTENDSGVEQQRAKKQSTRRIKREKVEARQHTDKSEIDLFLEPEIDLSYNNCKCTKFEDPDKDFLMSILPDVKRIHDDYKIDFKSEMLQLIKNYKRAENFKIE